MVAAGDGAKPIYMTELGWSSTSAECETGALGGPEARRRQPSRRRRPTSTQAYHCLAQPQYSYVKAAMWFELFDEGTTTGPLDNFGLLNPDCAPKPAFAAFERSRCTATS